MQIRSQAAGALLWLKAQRVPGSADHPIVDVGAKVKRLTRSGCFDPQLDRYEWHVIDRDSALFDRSHKEIAVTFALKYGREQFDQGGPPDWGLEIVPSSVGGDPHVEVTAERRIPQVHRRKAACRFCGAREGVERYRRMPFLRHGLPDS